ncbi:hypothetical protein BKA67DRAFT_552588 [Truncatella angustata]|uniref:Uncharacterized protein n=1 Tax=Truncatella angustata TaxID=152316 RepID=A0A9P8UR35_9PEZI|nr:uncharacterized protein BKA67DRAFT_552588 [Truncatella angustata]KAH6656656.1 hypothetical protein BKA67DRAFT_552588 [Truncatella angustata]
MTKLHLFNHCSPYTFLSPPVLEGVLVCHAGTLKSHHMEYLKLHLKIEARPSITASISIGLLSCV